MREMSCADFPGEHRRPNALRAGDLELHLLVEEHLDRAVPRHEAELEEHAGRRRARRHAGGDRLDDQQLEDVSSPHAHEKPQCVHERDYRVRRAAARPAQPLRDTPPRSVRAGRRALRALMGSRIADAAATRDATSD